MTHRERILTVLSRQPADRVPLDLGGFNREAARLFVEKTGSHNHWEYFGVEADWRGVGFAASKEKIDHRPFHSNLPEDMPLNEWGTGFIQGSNPAYDHFVAPLTAAKSVQEIQAYPLYDVTPAYRHEHLESTVKSIHDAGYAAFAGMACTIFEVAWQIRGYNELLMDFYDNPDMAECLLDRITTLRCFMAKRYAEAGTDILGLGDDVGMEHKLMISPSIWYKWLGSRLAQVIKSAREVKPDIIIHYHSDGYIEPIIPQLIEIGLNVLNPVQPECMNPARLKKLYGAHLAFWGTIGIQHTMPFGAPDDVRKEVKERIATVGKNGGLVIAPTHVLAPEVPLENIAALVEATKEYGGWNN
jgi:uroporphyrinogen decarboxylase